MHTGAWPRQSPLTQRHSVFGFTNDQEEALAPKHEFPHYSLTP